MLFAWFRWWWDPMGLDRAQVILGTIGIAVTGALGLVAWWLAKRQVEIARRQMDIQEEQHKLFERQSARKTDLRMTAQGVETKIGTPDFRYKAFIKFYVHNGGDKSAEPFYWELLIPDDLAGVIHFVDVQGNRLAGKMSHLSAAEHYRKLDGLFDTKLPAFTGMEVARVMVDPFHAKLANFSLKWRIRSDDGLIPAEGLAFISFKAEGDGTYRWTRWHPGQREEDIRDEPEAP